MTDIGGINRDSAPADWGAPHRKVIQWYDAKLVSATAEGMTGLEYVRAMGRSLPMPPIASVVDFRVTTVELGQIELTATTDESLLNPAGFVQGGVLCTLMDVAMGIAVHTTLDPGLVAVSIELKVSFLEPLSYDGGEVRVTAQVLKRGRRVSFEEAHAHEP